MSDPKNPASSADPNDLPEEIRRRLDALDERLGTIDHYTLLGLTRTATRAQVRSALLTSAPAFHPDRYFGKKIDPAYKAKMERVFARMALAHDTLIDDVRRKDYDRALPPPLPSFAAAKAPPPLPGAAPAPSPSPAQPASSSSARMPVARHAAPSDPGRDAQHPPSRPPGAPGSVRPPSASSPEFDRSRAQAFASRLAGGAARTRQPTPVHAFHALGTPKAGQPMTRTPAAGTPAATPNAAVDALRRRYEEQVARASTKQATSQLQAAEQAVARGDHQEALRLYRSAIEHASDPAAKAALEQAEHRVRDQAREAAIQKAKDLEQKQDFASAGGAWARAFDLVPSAEVAFRAASCLRKAGTDMRRAAKFGEESVKIDPNKLPYRVTLALIYADLGLALRARGEIERALALDPKNASAKEAAQKIKGMG